MTRPHKHDHRNSSSSTGAAISEHDREEGGSPISEESAHHVRSLVHAGKAMTTRPAPTFRSTVSRLWLYLSLPYFCRRKRKCPSVLLFFRVSTEYLIPPSLIPPVTTLYLPT